jgi:hypothetical protein
MRAFIFVVLITGTLMNLPSHSKPKRIGHAHTHGKASVDIGVEGNRASVSFSIDTHSLLGFERAAKTAEEKQAVKKVYETFRSNFTKMFGFDPKLNCKFEEQKLRIGPEGKHHGNDHSSKGEKEGHQSLKGEFSANCAQKIAPSKVYIDLKSSYSSIQKIKVHILTDAVAESIDLPGSGQINLR